MDWGLLQSQSKNWFLRDKLLIPHRSVYFGAVVSKKNTWQIRIILLALVAQNWNCGTRMKWKKKCKPGFKLYSSAPEQVLTNSHDVGNAGLECIAEICLVANCLEFPTAFLHRQSLVAIVASLEIIGRGIWNFSGLTDFRILNFIIDWVLWMI